MASENTSSTNVKPVDISELVYRFWKVFKRLWIMVVVLAVIGGAYSAYKAKKSYVPIYEATAFFSVDAGYSGSDIFNSSYYDSRLADQLADAFPYMLGTGIMTDMMKDHLGTSYINGSVSAASVASTGMFVMRVNSRSPQDAYDVLWAAIECYPQVAVYMVDDPQIILREEPVMPTKPVYPFSYKTPLLKGAAAGALAGLAIIALLAFSVKKITSAEQLKSELNRPVVSVLPFIRIKKRRNAADGFIMAATDTGLSESFKGMSHKVQRKLAETGGKIVLVTSTSKNEGKTTVSANLAAAMAKDGNKVVILDADLRNQSIAERFSAEECSKGLIQLMYEPNTDVMSVVKRLEDTGLYYISSKSISGNRYSIDHNGLTRVLQELRREFDCVVIDTPPCGLVADTGFLSRYADMVLYVVRADYAAESRVIDAVNSLYDRGGSVTGFIFNGADVKRRSYGYGYKYGYGYGYKYGYGYGRRYGYGYGKKDSEDKTES